MEHKQMIKANRVRSLRSPQATHCSRCGRDVKRDPDRYRKDGLVLCQDCTGDTWFIQTAGKPC